MTTRSPLSSLRVRIALPFLLSFALFLAAGAVAGSWFGDVAARVRVLNAAWLPLSRDTTRLEAALDRRGPALEALRGWAETGGANLNGTPRTFGEALAATGPSRLSGLQPDRVFAAVDAAMTRVQEARQLTPTSRDLATLAVADDALLTVARLQTAFDEELELLARDDPYPMDRVEALQRLHGDAVAETRALVRLVEDRGRALAEEVEAGLARAGEAAARLAAVAFVLGLALLLLASRALEPLAELTRQVQRVAGGERGVRVPWGRSDEIGVLATELGVMAASIQERDEALRSRAQELDRARVFLRSVVDAVRVGLAVVQEGRVTMHNPAAAEQWGAAVGDLLPPPMAATTGGEVELDGRTLALTRVPFREGDLVLSEDVTERNRVRERLARSERLALVGQMFAQVTHEVRNPLNAMSLNAELLAEELAHLAEPHRAEATAMLHTLASGIELLETLTGQYLDAARRPAPVLAPTSPADVVDEVLHLLDEELRRAGVKVEVAHGHAASDAAPMDGGQVARALINVVRNAVEAGARSIRVEVDGTPPELVLAVIDDGPGMPPVVASQASTPFFTTKAMGTGLGLAVTRQIAEDHEGTLSIESSERGTRVALSLPRQRR